MKWCSTCGSLILNRPEPAFAAPWHAQVFALTIALHEVGRFTWSDWAACFSAQLKTAGLAQDLDGGDDYFTCWLEALETLLRDQDIAMTNELSALKSAWTDAYLSTPHGHPVTLKDV